MYSKTTWNNDSPPPVSAEKLNKMEDGIYLNSHTLSKIPFKNIIINGDFSVWQRGESFTIGDNTAIYTADRMKTANANGAGGQFTVSKSELNNQPSFKITVDTAVSDLTSNKFWRVFYYLFEGHHLYKLANEGKDITISFLFKSNVTGKYAVALVNYTDTSSNYQSYVTTFEYNNADTIQKVEITIPMNATWNPALQYDVNRGFVLSIGFINNGDYATSTTNQWIDGNYKTTSDCVNWGANVGNYIEIAELQLEEGSVATEFERIPFDIQLQRCLRYYEELKGTLPAYVNDSSKVTMSAPVAPKRTKPSLSTDFSVINREPKDETDLTSFGAYTYDPLNGVITIDIACSTSLVIGDSEDCSGVDFLSSPLILDAEL